MLGASKSDCRGSPCWLLILSPRTVPNMSAYRPDYLFHAAIAVRESYLSKSHVSKDIQDGLLIMALGNGLMQD